MVGEVVDRVAAGGAEKTVGVLRTRWRSSSFSSGWRFPSDWAVPEVDDVCAAVLREDDPTEALAELGRARARAGVGLDETLQDFDALWEVLESTAEVDSDATRSVTALMLGWANTTVTVMSNIDQIEPLTGLATTSYLRIRMGEVYRRAARTGDDVTNSAVLLTISVDLSELTEWTRFTAMILVGDVLHDVFDGYGTVAALGPSTAVVLTERDKDLAGRAASLRGRITARATADPELITAAQPRIALHRLPTTLAAAHDLLRHIGTYD